MLKTRNDTDFSGVGTLLGVLDDVEGRFQRVIEPCCLVGHSEEAVLFSTLQHKVLASSKAEHRPCRVKQTIPIGGTRDSRGLRAGRLFPSALPVDLAASATRPP